MANSDLSGEPLEGGRTPTRIIVEFPDGTKKSATVAADEAHALAENGDDVASARRRLASWLRANSAKLFWIVVGAYIASVVVPAITQQWSDRAKESDLKGALVTKISESASDSVSTARFISGDVLPEAAARVQADQRLGAAEQAPRPHTKQQVAEIGALRKALDLAIDDEKKAEQKTFNTIKNDWNKAGASIEAQLEAYFPKTDLPTRWHEYYKRVADYVRLASSICNDGRKDVTKVVQKYIETSFSSDAVDWGTLDLQDERSCQGKPEAFQSGYYTAGDELLDVRETIVREIVKSNTSGYSVGRHDLLRAITLR